MRPAIFVIAFGVLAAISLTGDANAKGQCLIMNRGEARGQCIDTSAKRAAVILSESHETFVFNNFYHAKRFWRATIKPNSVRRVVFQVERFPSGFPGIDAAHTQLRFDMATPLVLVPLDGGAPTTLKSFVASYEYLAPKGVPYDLVKGQFDNYNIVGRMISLQTRAGEESGHHIYNYPLLLQRSAATAVAVQAVRESANLGMFLPYNTISFNCTTEVFKVLDDGLNYQGPRFSMFNIKLLQFDPVVGGSLEALKQRGLIQSYQE